MSGITSKQPTQGVSYNWAVAFTPAAKQCEIDQKVNKKYQSLKCIDSTHFDEKDEKNVYVGWDQGKVVSSDKGQPYSTQMGPCIAVLIRAQENNEPCQLGMVHIFNDKGVQVVKEKLQELAAKTHDASIDIFISGGKNSVLTSKARYHQVLDIIETTPAGGRIVFCDDKFGIADGLDSFLEDENGTVYSSTVGISYAGFNSENNPCLEIDAKVIGYKGDLKALKPYTSGK